MKVEIRIERSLREPEAEIRTPEMTDEVARAVRALSEEAPRQLVGYRDDQTYLIPVESLCRVYSEGGHVMASTDREGAYQIKARLYQLEESLGVGFVRISNGEIVRLNKVRRLDLSIAGTIRMELTNGEWAFVSRRYVGRIREMLRL